MNTQLEPRFGHDFFPFFSRLPRPAAGGRRPPRGGNGRGSINARRWRLLCGALALGAAVTSASAQISSSGMPDLNGTYRCEGAERACTWSGWTFTVAQSGTGLEIRNERGDTGHADFTSAITVSAGPVWNMLGVLGSPDGAVIQWSNGTIWRRQTTSNALKDSTLLEDRNSAGRGSARETGALPSGALIS